MLKCSDSCVLDHKTNDNFIGWLVEVLAPVLMGSKPAELLSFPKNDKHLLKKIDSVEKHVGRCKRITYKLFKSRNGNTKVLFYNPKILDLCLREYRNIKFLRSLGYPKKYDLDKYIEIIINSIIDGAVPHEIGVFLGYPLKDIMGFIGHPALKLTKINGWRVYGDPRLSDKKFNEFLEAKNKIKKLLKFNEPEKVLISI